MIQDPATKARAAAGPATATPAGPGFYRDMAGTTHRLALPEIAVTAIPEDERVWVPQAPGVWFWPPC